MIILDPESQVAVNNEGHVIYNCDHVNLVEMDRNILTCEWSDTNPNHTHLLLLAELFFGRKYPRFIDLYRVISRNDTVFLREWEKVKDTIKNEDFDRHQILGKKRAVTMKVAVLTFISMLTEKRALTLASALSRLMRLSVCTYEKPIDIQIDYNKSKNNFFEIYKKLADCPDWDSLNMMVLKNANSRGYVQNFWGRRLHLNGEPPHERIPKLTENKTNTILGWLIHSSVHDTAIYTANYLNQILEPHGGTAYAGYQCVNVLLGRSSINKLEIFDFAKNPDSIFEEDLECVI